MSHAPSSCARIALALAALLAVSCSGGSKGHGQEDGADSAAAFEWPTGARPHAVLSIAGRGEIELELFPELAPATVANFEKLVREEFYLGTIFHRVVPDFMIQGGDPYSKDLDPANDGMGGPDYQIPDEFSDAPHERGVISMANLGQKDTGGSQFFILQSDARHLDGRHAVFGRVVRGIELVDEIAAVEVDAHGRWGPAQRPIERIEIAGAWLLDPEGEFAGGSDPEAAQGPAAAQQLSAADR